MERATLPETNSLPLKIDAWETILSFSGSGPIFKGELFVLSEGNPGWKGKLARNLGVLTEKNGGFLDQGIPQENARNGGSGSIVILQ